jgi:NCS1 family nucleobase:cation symporter-1
MGAKKTYSEQAFAEKAEAQRKAIESDYLKDFESNKGSQQKESLPFIIRTASVVSYLSLIVCASLGLVSYLTQDIELVRTWLLLPTLVYFVTATYAYLQKAKIGESLESTDHIEQDLAAVK